VGRVGILGTHNRAEARIIFPSHQLPWNNESGPRVLTSSLHCRELNFWRSQRGSSSDCRVGQLLGDETSAFRKDLACGNSQESPAEL
jgi:hypothetical protein